MAGPSFTIRRRQVSLGPGPGRPPYRSGPTVGVRLLSVDIVVTTESSLLVSGAATSGSVSDVETVTVVATSSPSSAAGLVCSVSVASRSSPDASGAASTQCQLGLQVKSSPSMSYDVPVTGAERLEGHVIGGVRSGVGDRRSRRWRRRRERPPPVRSIVTETSAVPGAAPAGEARASTWNASAPTAAVSARAGARAARYVRSAARALPSSTPDRHRENGSQRIAPRLAFSDNWPPTGPAPYQL